MGYALKRGKQRLPETFNHHLYSGIEMITARPLIDFKMFATGDWLRWVVRQHWGYEYEEGREKLRMPCCHGCPPSRGNRTFALDYTNGKWYTFCCKAGGDALTLWAFLTGLPVYYAAIDLCRKRQLPIPFVNQVAGREA